MSLCCDDVSGAEKIPNWEPYAASAILHAGNPKSLEIGPDVAGPQHPPAVNPSVNGSVAPRWKEV